MVTMCFCQLCENIYDSLQRHITDDEAKLCSVSVGRLYNDGVCCDEGRMISEFESLTWEDAGVIGPTTVYTSVHRES